MIELKAWTIHYFERRREFLATYCILKRYRDGRLIWDAQAIDYKNSMDRVLENVVAFAKRSDGTIPIIYYGNLSRDHPNDCLFDWGSYQDALSKIDYDAATLTELFLEIFDEQSARS